MTREELKIYIENKFPNKKIEETTSFLVMYINPEELIPIATELKTNQAAQFDFLFCQTAVDKQSHFELIYNLTSTNLRHTLVLKISLEDRNNAEVESVYPLWQAAELYECEIFDMFGIRFNNHPSLRRIFLGENWTGYPLRKDYSYEGNELKI